MLRPANYWHMLPEKEHARKAIWKSVNPHTGKRRIDEAFPPEIRAPNGFNDHEMTITLVNGSIWSVQGSDNYNTLVGAGVAGVVYSEWSRADPNSWSYLSPMLDENNGWALFITTPFGHNHCKRMHEMAETNPKWFAQTLTVDDTHAIPPEVVQEALSERIALYGEQMGTMMWRQEWYCTFENITMGALFSADDLAGIWKYDEAEWPKEVEELEAW